MIWSQLPAEGWAEASTSCLLQDQRCSEPDGTSEARTHWTHRLRAKIQSHLSKKSSDRDISREAATDNPQKGKPRNLRLLQSSCHGVSVCLVNN